MDYEMIESGERIGRLNYNISLEMILELFKYGYDFICNGDEKTIDVFFSKNFIGE